MYMQSDYMMNSHNIKLMLYYNYLLMYYYIFMLNNLYNYLLMLHYMFHNYISLFIDHLLYYSYTFILDNNFMPYNSNMLYYFLVNTFTLHMLLKLENNLYSYFMPLLYIMRYMQYMSYLFNYNNIMLYM